MSDKRLQVLINDEESLAWLKAQDNMSASIRLLIQQIARDGSKEDYVMYCAKQAPSPFAKQSVAEVDSSKSFDEVAEDLGFEQDEVVKQKVEKEVVETVVDDKVEKVVEDEIVEETVDSDEVVDDIDWEKEDDKKLSRVEQMLADRKKELE